MKVENIEKLQPAKIKEKDSYIYVLIRKNILVLLMSLAVSIYFILIPKELPKKQMRNKLTNWKKKL